MKGVGENLFGGKLYTMGWEHVYSNSHRVCLNAVNM